MTEENIATPPRASSDEPGTPPVVPSTRKAPAIAWVAVGIAIFALIVALIPFATFGAGLFILAGLILSIIALAKARGTKGAAITALILSLVAVPATIVMSIVSIGLIAAVGTTLDSTLIEQQIARGISDQLGITAVATCPRLMVGTTGTVFQCEAVDPNGDSVIVDVTVTDNVGDVSWAIRN